MLRRKKDIVRTLYLIVTFPFRVLYHIVIRPAFFILWHPVTLLLSLICLEALMVSEGSMESFRYISGNEKNATDIAMWGFFGFVVTQSIGFGWRLSGYILHHDVLPFVSMCALSAAGLYSYMVYGTVIRNSLLLLSNTIVFIIIFSSAAVLAIFRYLFSKNPGPLISSPKVAFATIRSGISGSISWIRSYPFAVFLILLQLGINIFLIYRLTSVETRLGGSIFSLCNADASISKANKSVIRIASEYGEGTGMLIRDDGIILTNAHVISKDPSPKVIFADYSFKPSKVLFRDDDKDIAVIKVDGTGYTSVMFEDPGIVPKRSQVYVHGYPLGTELRGDATTSTFSFVAVRSMKDVPTEIVQLDGLGTGGASGAPVLTSCGGVIGMFTSGEQGISFAISSKSIEKTIDFLNLDPSEWPKPPEYPLEPDKSAVEAVRAFYTFLKMRDFKRAYLMQTPERVQSAPLEEWLKGYDKNIDFSVVSIVKAPNQPSPTPTPMMDSRQKPSGILLSERVIVRIRTLDLEGQDIVAKYFEGPWIVVFDGEFWRLSQSNIKYIEKPPWDWFW